MKNSLLTIIILIISTRFLEGQILDFGVKGGLGISNTIFISKMKSETSDSIINSYNVQPLFSASINSSVLLNKEKQLAFGFEPGIIRKGFKSSFFDTVSFIYIQLPIIVSYRISDNFRLEPTVELGHILFANGHSNSTRVNLKQQGIYDQIGELSLGGSIRYNIKEKFDVGIKFSKGITSLETIHYPPSNGSSSGAVFIEDRSQYLHFYIFYSLKKLE